MDRAARDFREHQPRSDDRRRQSLPSPTSSLGADDQPAGSRLEMDDVERGDGFEETLEMKLADRLDLHEVFHRAQQTLGDEDLAGLGLPAEA